MRLVFGTELNKHLVPKILILFRTNHILISPFLHTFVLVLIAVLFFLQSIGQIYNYIQSNCTELEPAPTQFKLGLSEMNLDTELIESWAELGLELWTSVSYSQGKLYWARAGWNPAQIWTISDDSGCRTDWEWSWGGVRAWDLSILFPGDVGCWEMYLMLLLQWLIKN